VNGPDTVVFFASTCRVVAIGIGCDSALLGLDASLATRIATSSLMFDRTIGCCCTDTRGCCFGLDGNGVAMGGCLAGYLLIVYYFYHGLVDWLLFLLVLIQIFFLLMLPWPLVSLLQV